MKKKKNRKFLVTEEQLKKSISDGLLDALTSHGDIGVNDLESVAKRVIGKMKKYREVPPKVVAETLTIPKEVLRKYLSVEQCNDIMREWDGVIFLDSEIKSQS